MTPYVFGFDRDETVSTNGPAERAAVPIEWIRYLAHETDHEVWAIGNQDLKEEADIPGDDEAAALYEERWGDPNDHVEERTEPKLEERVIDGPAPPDPDLTTALHVRDVYGGRLERQQRLRLLSALFPEATRYIVVDNFYLGHVDDWTHFFPWEFVSVVELGADLASVPVESLE